MLMTDKNKQKLKQINYMSCEHEGHEGEPLSRVCIDRECKMKTLICGMCEEEKHQSHQTMPLKNFLQKFCMGQSEKNSKNKQNMSSLYYAHKLDEVRSSFFDSIQHFKMQINQALAQLESQAKIYFNEVSERLRIFVGIENPIEYFSKQGASQSRIKKYLEQLLENFKVKQKFSLAGKLQQLVNRGYEKEKMLTTSLSKIKTESLAFMGKLKKGLQPESLNKIERVLFAWSQELKGTKMKINGNIAQQTGMESSGQRFIMLEPSLTDGLFYEDKICWGIKVIKFVGWIGVGICLKNVITKANFFFNYTTVGHGSYMISNNGYSWSHSLLQFNSAHKTFHYAQNDIVYIEYDKKAKKLRFTKNKGPQKFELDIADPPSGDSYYPCANICSTGDAIQVINQVGESS